MSSNNIMYDHKTNKLIIIDYGMYVMASSKSKKLPFDKGYNIGTPIYWGRESINFILQKATSDSNKTSNTITTTNDDTESCMKIILEMFVP